MLGTTTTSCQIQGLFQHSECLSAEWSSLCFLLSILGEEPGEGARRAENDFSSHVVHVKQCLPSWNPVRICEGQHSGFPAPQRVKWLYLTLHGLFDDLADFQMTQDSIPYGHEARTVAVRAAALHTVFYCPLPGSFR